MKRDPVIHLPILGVTRGLVGLARCGRVVTWWSGDHQQTLRDFARDSARGDTAGYCRACIRALVATRRRRAKSKIG